MMRDYQAMLAEIDRRATMPHGWGSNDCVCFAAAMVRAQTGVDPLRGLRWTTATGAGRVLARLGGMEAAVDARLPRIAPAMARRGDIAGVPDPDRAFGLILMVVEGATLVGPGESGIRRLPRAMMTTAWSAAA